MHQAHSELLCAVNTVKHNVVISSNHGDTSLPENSLFYTSGPARVTLTQVKIENFLCTATERVGINTQVLGRDWPIQPAARLVHVSHVDLQKACRGLCGLRPVQGSKAGVGNGQEEVECGRERPIRAVGEVCGRSQEPARVRGNRCDQAKKTPTSWVGVL